MLRAVANVNLAAVERNCARIVAALQPESKLCAVVKADGYGHGAVEVAKAAIAGGAVMVAVVSAQEAQQLRMAGFQGRVLLMGALARGEETELAVKADTEPVVWDREFQRYLSEVVAKSGRTDALPVHYKLDTGMGRLGTRDPGYLLELLAQGDPLIKPVGVMTHFATADEDNTEFFTQQLAAFRTFQQQIKQHTGVNGASKVLIAHAANSAATLREPSSHFDMVRCGIAIYGLDPYGNDPTEQGLEPALELCSYVAAVKACKQGQSVGYGRRFVAAQDTQIATVPIGYGDGVRRALTNNADVLIAGKRYPVVGTVSMDNITVNLGLDSGVLVGEPVTLIGRQGQEQILVEELAKRADTINYEIVCGISPRVPRSYHFDD